MNPSARLSVEDLAIEFAAKDTWPLYPSTPVQKIVCPRKYEGFLAGHAAGMRDALESEAVKGLVRALEDISTHKDGPLRQQDYGEDSVSACVAQLALHEFKRARGGELKRKYFDGPEGVYYNPQGDNILLLERMRIEEFFDPGPAVFFNVALYECSTRYYSNYIAAVRFSDTLIRVGEL